MEVAPHRPAIKAQAFQGLQMLYGYTTDVAEFATFVGDDLGYR